MKEFQQDFDTFLLDNIYSTVDIYPLIKKYNNGQHEINSSIRLLINSYNNDGLITINDDSIYNLAWIPPSAIELPDREIFVTPTSKLKDKNTPSVSHTIYNLSTVGDNSPIAGHDLTMGDIVQSSSKTLDLKPDQRDESNHPEIKAQTKAKCSWLIKAGKYIGDNIVKVIVTIIGAYIVYRLGFKK